MPDLQQGEVSPDAAKVEDGTRRRACPVCGATYEGLNLTACIAGCYCPNLDELESEGDEQP